MEEFIHHSTYLGVVLILLLGGMGLPLPEDVPLLISGYLCHLEIADVHLMVPIAFSAVLAGDFIMYSLGARFGDRVSRLPLLNRFLTPERLKKALDSFHKHGGKTLFIARFLPGIRACVFFSAGAFKLPAWKMLVFDGSAALISVPTLILAAYFGGEQIDKVKSLAGDVQLALLGVILLVIGIWYLIKRKTRATETPPPLRSADSHSE